MANAKVSASFAGIITDLDLKVGEFAASGPPVLTIADLSRWVVKTTDLTEIEVVSASEGQLVTVTLRGDLLHTGVGLLVLLVVQLLNVYKPRGTTPYGWRKQHEQRTVSPP